MRVLIVSDTHGRSHNLISVLEMEQPIDLLIHLGDLEGDEDILEPLAECPVEMVAGNNDYFSKIPREKIIQIGNFKALITHGHNFHVSFGIQDLKEEAISLGVDIVMFGHTHRPFLEIDENLTVLNPGSLSFPRQEKKLPSYIIMEIDDGNCPHFSIHTL